VITHFNIIVSTFYDWFQQIGMMSHDWQVGFPHSSAVAQIIVDSVDLSVLSAVGYFRTVVNGLILNH
jgi:hypothetical protein